MSDERFEEFLQREAKAYNEPPADMPRDAMWEAVSKARAARLADTAGVVVHAAHRPVRRARYASWIGMAATLLIGVGIGRFALQRGGPVMTDGQVASLPTGATAPLNVPDVPGTDGRDTTAPVGSAPQADTARAAQQVAREVTRGPRVVPVNVNRVNGVNGMAGAPATTPYSVASQRHLASAEALITVVTATPRDAMMDSLTTRWAREMLSSTRLLLDSPAGDEPLRRRLLEDLETLLVQLVQRSGGAVDERDLIDRTLQRTQLLTRLRTNAAGT
jgi:hypothetical protein